MQAERQGGKMRSAAFFEDDARRKTGGGGRRPSTRPVLPDFDGPADGSGSRRRAPAAEAESPVGRPSNWFLHDDRDLQAEGLGGRGGSGDQSGGRRDSRRGGRVQPGPGAARYSRPGEWEYVDPKGVIQGPFSSKEVLKWADAGFFTPDQQVRRAGEERFASLRACMHQLQQDVKGPLAESPTQRGGRGGSMAQTDVSYRKPRPSRSLEQAPDGSYKGHPADALLSPDQIGARREELEAAGPGRGGHGRRGGLEGPGGRGSGRDGEQGYGRRGGRSSYGDGSMRSERPDRRGSAAAAAQPSPEPEGPKLPHSLKVAQRLFTGDATLATEEPVWRYVDPSGQTQGPFPARNMLEWYRRGLLNDMSLQTCGAERKVAPPDFPQPEHYRPLGTLLQSIKRGQRFHPLSVLDIRAGQGNAYHPFGKGPREAKAATSSAQEQQAPTGVDSLPKRSPSARGRGKTQGPIRGTAPAEDEQRVSLQLAHGMTEEEGIKVALSLGGPASLPSPAESLPANKPGGAPEMPGKIDSAAPAAGPADGNASLSPRAPGTHGMGASHDDVATPILAPASQLGPGFVATPEKPSAPDFEGAAPQAPPPPSAAQHMGTNTDEPDTSAQDAATEHTLVPHSTAEMISMMPAEVGSTAGPLAEAAAAHSQNSTAEEPASLTAASAESKQPAAPKGSQPDKEAEFVPAEGSLSSIHVHSAPSNALDAAERGESPAAAADGDAAGATFGKAVEPDPEAAEKVHNILEDNVKAVEAANDSTADTLDAGLHMHGGASADTLDEREGRKDSTVSPLSHMTQPGVASAGDAKVTEPATESPELLGVAGAGEQKTQPGDGAEPEVAAANYHTQGTGQPGEEDSAAEPAMAAPELLGVPAAGHQGLQHATIEAQEEPVTESAEVLGVDSAGEQESQPGDSAESGIAAANYHTQGTGEPAEDSAAEPAMAAPELLGVPAAGDHGSQHATTEAHEEPVTESAEVLGVASAGEQISQPGDSAESGTAAAKFHIQGTGQPAGDSAVEPAMAAPELLGIATGGEQGSQHVMTEAQEEPHSQLGQAAGDSATAKGTSKPGAGLASHTKLSGKEEPAAEHSAATMTEAGTITQAAAETPGDVKAAEPAEGSAELLGFAKTTDAASEPVGSPAAAAAEGDEIKTAPAQEAPTEAATHLQDNAGRTVHPAEATADKSGSGAQEEGSEQGRKEHGSLFASARAFFKRKEADGKH